MMLNRRHIRVKVMQTLYAFNGTESDDFSKDQKFLLFSIDNMYNLYLLLMSLLIEINKKATTQLEISQKKILATDEEKNPNKKFINNQLIQLIVNNEVLKNEIEDKKINNWQLDDEYVDLLYKEILKSDLYKDYMATKTASFKEDKNFILDIYKEIIAPNDKLYDYIEDKHITWLDDVPTVNTFILKQLKKLKETSDAHFLKPKLYKDLDDKEYAIKLFKKTLLNQSALAKEISSKTSNWETDRIASIDMVLLKMAICELLHFSSIPTKVTINEYLELAKEYSTPKSSIFINGILDKLLKQYEDEGKLNKVGRGLM